MRAGYVWFVTLLVVMVTAAASTAALGPQATQPETAPWVHAEVSGAGGEDMRLNLPLAALEAALALAPGTVVRDGQLRLGTEHEVPVAAFRGLWRELRGAGDTDFATIRHDGRDVRIARDGGTLLVAVSGPDGADAGAAQVEIPLTVVDALLSGEGETLDLRAAIRELGTLRGEVVRVSADRNVVIWIDERPTQ